MFIPLSNNMAEGFVKQMNSERTVKLKAVLDEKQVEREINRALKKSIKNLNK